METVSSPKKQNKDADFQSTLSTQCTDGAALGSPVPTQDVASPYPKVSLQTEIERMGLRAFLEDVVQKGEAMTALELSDNCLGDEGAQTLREVLSESKHLRRLGLSRTGFGLSGLQEIAILVDQCPSLEALILASVNLNCQPIPTCFSKSVAAAPALRVLHISHCRLTCAQFHPLSAALGTTTASQLDRLNLSYNNLTAPAMADFHRLLLCLSCLSTLQLTSNSLGPRGGEVLAEGIAKAPNSALRRLQVENNSLTLRGCRALVRIWLQSGRAKPMLHLDLRDNGVSQPQCAELSTLLGKPQGGTCLTFDGGARTVLLSWPDRQGTIVYNRHTSGRTDEAKEQLAKGEPADVRWRS